MTNTADALINLPADGAIITFARIPAGSYASENTAYRVQRGKAHVHLRNVATGSGTSDSHWAYARAEWTVLQR